MHIFIKVNITFINSFVDSFNKYFVSICNIYKLVLWEYEDDRVPEIKLFAL